MESFWSFWYQVYKASLGYFFSPSKRIHLLYLATSLLLALWVFYRQKRKGSFLRYVFHPRVWLSSSARVDYALFVFNGVIKVLLIMPYIYYGFYIAFWLEEELIMLFGYQQEVDKVITMIAYTICITLLSDLASYLAHRAMHRVPFMWSFHSVHHSADVMNPITQYRMHPLELILNNIIGIIVFGITTGFFRFLSGNIVSLWSFMGANIFSFLFFLFGANLRHSHIPLSYPKWLEKILISPRQHQLHHSKAREHHNRNFGARFALWDWIFGSLIYSKDHKGRLSYGIGQKKHRMSSSFSANLLAPFRYLASRLRA